MICMARTNFPHEFFFLHSMQHSDNYTRGGHDLTMKDQTTIFYADFHIHIGRTENGKPVKISGSNNLTFFNIIKEAAERKGMDMIGIIDCHVPEVQIEMKRYMNKGWLEELPGGG